MKLQRNYLHSEYIPRESALIVLSSVILSDRREYQVFKELLRIVPGLETRLMENSETETIDIADLVSDSLLPIENS